MRHPSSAVIAAVALLLSQSACGRRAGSAAAAQGGSPIVVLISLDGFRYDYLDREPTPHLRRLAASGVRARWMQPVFPTLTFPNHYTIVTGLLPAHHGIVGNTFVDPADNARFRYTDTLVAPQSRWWGGEPLWVTASRQGRRTAAFFWPGSDAEIGGVRPDRWKKYDGRVPNRARVDTVLSWLGQPEAGRPALVTLYFSEVDHAGHEYGPDTPELVQAVAELDSMIGRLMSGVGRLGLEDRVNVIVVSDHGMAASSPQRQVVIDDYVDRNSVNAVSLGQFISLIPNDGDTNRLLRAFANAPHLQLYAADRTPARWRYSGNRRISPVVGVAESGWVLTSRASQATGRGARGGGHGHDNTDSLMRATFIAAGPAFKRGYIAEPFQNLHVYELVCAILGLRPAPNDGSVDSVRLLLR
jgi:predicted AlkP superfamily pyrophosphatase or phosphodiesterase